MSYLTLDEAAQYATEQKRFKVEPSVLLRSGVLGMLPICAAFGAGRMHNALTQQEEDLTPCLLIIPPKHLLELETEGTAIIHCAHSLDGGMYFPEKQRTREHLRVMVAHLDKFLEMLIDTTQETNTPPAKSKAVTGTTPAPVTITNKLRRNNLDPAIDKAIKLAGNINLADVYLELKALAIDGEKPFTGALEGDALLYTNDDNNLARFTKNALGKRLKIRR